MQECNESLGNYTRDSVRTQHARAHERWTPLKELKMENAKYSPNGRCSSGVRAYEIHIQIRERARTRERHDELTSELSLLQITANQSRVVLQSGSRCDVTTSGRSASVKASAVRPQRARSHLRAPFVRAVAAESCERHVRNFVVVGTAESRRSDWQRLNATTFTRM